MNMTVGKKNDRKTLDSAGFTKAAELITGSTRMTTRKPHRFGQNSANSRFYTEWLIDTTGICPGRNLDWIKSCQ